MQPTGDRIWQPHYRPKGNDGKVVYSHSRHYFDGIFVAKAGGEETWQFFQQIFEPSIGCLISPYNLAFLRANLAMGRKSQIFHQKSTRSACVSSRHCRRARRFSRQIVMARPAPLVARSTATRHSRAELPERPTRASRETGGCRLCREIRWGGNRKFIQAK